MTETAVTAAVTDIAQEATETTAVDTDSIAVVISSAMESDAGEGDKLKLIFKIIANKFIDMLPSIGAALIAFALGIILAKILLHFTRKLLHRSRIDNAAESFLTSLLKIFLYVMVLIIALSIMNVPMTSLIAVLSTAGLAIGLALQNSLSNVAGGFIILLNKPFGAGDYIETNSASGFVDSISILYTKITTLDNKTVYIPNGSVASSVITNFTDKDVRRVDLEFGISYADDVEFAKEIIINTAKANKLILSEPKQPFARLKALAEDSLMIKAEVWTATENYWQVRYDMTEQVYAAFEEKGVTVPFRQLDVHIQKD